MAVSHAYKIIWGTGIVLVILPHLNLGLLSDYKICGDSECESLMSRVQATRDHHGKDCRFLSFRRGDTISVYHKLTGKREDLWAGSIGKQFGYFPKDAVQEEQLYATMEKVVETQKSDFFCMDESGYPIDSSHLDGDTGRDDQIIQNQESETAPNSDGKNAGSPSTSADPSTESPHLAQEAEGTATEEDERGKEEEAHKAPAAPYEQGGSASSLWLGSSVTGWLGLTKEEEPGNVDKGGKTDDRTETQAEASFTSSVTGWLGLGGEGKPDAVRSREEEESADSFTSAMTGWLGFGGERKNDRSAEKEQNAEGEKDGEEESAEKFRSRKMSLDLEGSQLHKEEKDEMGTLDWLGEGLSSTLGFGQTNQESGHETTSERQAEERIQDAEEHPAPNSWFDMGIGDILGFRKDKGDESTGIGFEKTEEDQTFEQPIASVDTSQSSQPALTGEVGSETKDQSKVEETPKDQDAPSETETVPGTTEPVGADSNNSNTSISDSSHDSALPEEAASMLNSFFQIGNKEEEEDSDLNEHKKDENLPDGSGSARMEGKDHQTPNLRENMGDNSSSVSWENEEVKTESDTDQDVLTQSDIHLGPDFSSVDLNSNSTGRSVGEIDKSSDTTDDSAEQSQVSGGGVEESSGERGPFSPDGDTAQSVDVDTSDSWALIDSYTEPETRLGQEEEAHPVEFGSSHSTNRSPEIMYETDTETGEVEESKAEQEQREIKEVEEIEALEKLQEIKEGEEFKEEGNLEEMGESKEEERQEEEEEIKKEEKKHEMEELNKEEKQEEVEELKQEERQEEVEELKQDEKQEEVEELKQDEKQDEVEELKKEEKHEEVEELKQEEKHKEVEELQEEEKQEEVEELKQEEKQEEVEELKQEEKQEEVEELQEEEKQEEVEELKEEEKQEEVGELQEEEKQEEVEELKEEEKQEEVGELKEEEKGEEEQSPHFEAGNIDSNEKKTQDVFSETSTQAENPQKEEEEREEENKKQKKVNEAGENVEGERRDKEEEVGVKCSNELGPPAGQDGLVHDRNGNDGANTLRSKEEEAGKKTPTADNHQIAAARTGASQTVPFKGLEDQNQTIPHQTENKDDNEANKTDISDDNVLRQGDKTKPEDTERELNMQHGDVRVTEEAHDRYTVGSKYWTEGGMGVSDSSSDSAESQAMMSEQTVPHVSQQPSRLSNGPNQAIAETERGGAFGLFKNAFSFFSQTSVSDAKEATGETPETQASLTPAQEPHSTADPGQVYVQDLHADSAISPSQQQLQPSPPSVQTASPPPAHTHPHPSSPSPNIESPLQTKTLSKHYKNLLAHLSADDVAILMELFGRHKLQFLDYTLGRSEAATDDPDSDESILLDVERLLHYHRETLVAPNTRTAQEDEERTRTLIALRKLEMLLARVREAFSTNHQAEASCVGESCSTHSKDKDMATGEESSKVGEVGMDASNPRDEWMWVGKEEDGQLSGGAGKERGDEGERGGERERSSEGERATHPPVRPGRPQPLEGVMTQILESVHQIAEARELLIWLTVQVVSSLPDDIRPGPDLYGVPWEPVIISSLVGVVTMLLFTCRCYSSVKSRMYQSRERWMAEQVAQLLDEKCKVLETLSKCQQEYDDLESSLRDSGVLAQTQKTEYLEVKAGQLGHDKEELEDDLEQLKNQLDQQREHRIEQERRIAGLEESMKTFEEETKDLQSQEEQAQTTLKVYSMNSDRLQKNLETAGEENTLLQESNAQLRQQVEGWAERVSELEAEMSRCEVAYSGMLQDVTNKDERIMSLTDRLLRMKAWDSDPEEKEGEEGGGKEASNGTAGRGEEKGRGDRSDTQGQLQKVQKLIYAAKLNADLKSVDEDKDRAFAKLNDEVKAKEDLQVSIKELENEKLSLQSDTEHYSDQVQRLQQKLQIMTEMYQENELKLHRLLTVEEKERMQKEEKLNKADKNIAMAMEELNNYRSRAGEMEEELDKTKQSYQTQISAHEKKAHNNWLAARAAERELADIRRENALLRQKLTDTQFKLDALDKDPYTLDSLARPLPFRAERSPYGPSPLGRPASETRAFLSPPTLMDGPPARLSPRVPRGPVEPPGGQGEMERSGGPHSDSGSNSPLWERDRRGPPPGSLGPLGPPGYMFPEPGGPMYRRPPPPPGALGLLPPPGSLPPGPLHPKGPPPGPPHPADMADGTYREASFGPGEQEHRQSGPGERRTPPEAVPRMGGAPFPGPPMGPMDGPFPRRAPYGPPPPDFYPPRPPGGPPMMPMWAPPPPGMMFPPRFPPGGPPHPHHVPPMRPPFPDGLPPPSMGPLPPREPLPSPPEEHTPSPEDAI